MRHLPLVIWLIGWPYLWANLKIDAPTVVWHNIFKVAVFIFYFIVAYLLYTGV